MTFGTVLIYAVQPSTAPTGICRYVSTLVHGLLAEHDPPRVVVCIGSWQAGYFRLLLGPDAQRCELAVVAQHNTLLGRYILAPLILHRQITTIRPDVVHFAAQTTAVFGALGLPTVLTIHDLYAYSAPESMGGANRLLNRLVTRMAIAGSGELIVVSATSRRALERYFPKAARRCRLLYQPVATKKPAQNSPKRSDTLGFLIVAGHRRHKNIDLAMRALDRLVDAGALPPTMRLTVVGASGNASTQLETLASSARFGVDFLHSVSDETLASFYEQSDAILIPSSDEGFCLPAIEAVQFGCPIVSSDIPIFGEVLQDRAVYFSLAAEDPVKDMARAIMHRLGLPRPAPQPDWFRDDEYGKKVLALYTQAMAH